MGLCRTTGGWCGRGKGIVGRLSSGSTFTCTGRKEELEEAGGDREEEEEDGGPVGGDRCKLLGCCCCCCCCCNCSSCCCCCRRRAPPTLLIMPPPPPAPACRFIATSPIESTLGTLLLGAVLRSWTSWLLLSPKGPAAAPAAALAVSAAAAARFTPAKEGATPLCRSKYDDDLLRGEERQCNYLS